MIRYDRERPLGAGNGRVASGPLTVAEEKIECMARQCWLIGQFWLVLYNQTIFYRFEEIFSYWPVQFFSVFQWSPFG